MPKLKAYQLKIFEHMCNFEIPEEWAYLIAERVAQEKNAEWVLKENNPVDALSLCFWFNETEEGVEFWTSVWKAIWDEWKNRS